MKNFIFCIQHMKSEIYSVRLREEKFYSHHRLVKILNLSMREYEEILRKDYNSITHPKNNGSRCIYFNNIDDARRARNWIEGLYIMNKLTR